MTDLTVDLRLEVQTAANDVLVLGVSTVSGYRLGGPADTAGSGIEWLNVLGTSHEISVVRGAKRDGLTLSLEAGVLNATVYDSVVDPNTNPYVKPGTPMRLMHDVTPVFTGVIRNVQVSYKGSQPVVRISAVDRVKDLANTNRAGVVEGTFAERVGDLLNKHAVPNTITGSSAVVLAQNAYDSTLLNHLNLAATSEQGRLFVAKDHSLKALGKDATYSATPVAYFTDQVADTADELSYVDISVAYDSAALANDIWVNNLTAVPNAEDPLVNDSVTTKYGPYRNVVSIATYGGYTEEVETNLDAADVPAFAAAVLSANDAPELRVDAVRINASNKPDLAAGLEVFDTVNIEYSNEAFHIGENFSVLYLEHSITASNTEHRWMVNVGLLSNPEVN